MTCSGGDSAQGADEAARLGIELPALSAATRERLAELLPSAATAANPLDYTSMVWGDIPALSELVRALGEDPAIGLVLVFYDQPAGLVGAMEESWRDVREGIMRGAVLSPVGTLVSSTLPELLDDAAAAELAAAGVPAAAGLRTGLRCARALLAAQDGDPTRLRAIAATARGRGPRDHVWLPEHAAKQWLREAGVPVPCGRVVIDGDDAVRALVEFSTGNASPLKPAIALKLSAASVQHKSELGGVALGLESAAEVREAYARLAVLAGERGGVVLAEAMAPAGIELIVAAHDDGVVPALVLGLGGIWTELLDDVAVVPLPADVSRVHAALLTLRGAPLLLGARGGSAVDLEAVASLAVRVGELVAAGEASLVECNPVFAGPGGAIAVDAAVRQ
jgi:acyl-CoA synthetase (NDP forming)